MSTMVQVDDGEMLIIGGLIDTVEAKDGKFAPGLGSIPGIKYLFGYEETRKEKRELVILLTPRII
jgi:general secretion pathway protein D/MSHA biogenesis protein MshL